MREGAAAPSVAVVFFAATLAHLTLYPGVADLDGFYHLGHAAAYLEGSLFDSSLPWATRSVIGDYGGDLWWGFHMLLLPFAALGDVALGMRLAGWALTAGLGIAVFWILRRHGVSWPAVWAAAFLLVVPNVLFRHLMVRPHVVSLAAGLTVLSVLVRGRWWWIAVLGALVSWVHLSLFWFVPGLALAYAVARVPVTVLLGREDPDTGVPIRMAVPAAIVGSLAGWLLRPDPLAAATLLNVQLVELLAAKAAELPLTFAVELSPLSPLELVRMGGLFAPVWLVALVGTGRAAARGDLARLGQAKATLLVSALLVSTAFLGLALVSARRAMEQWVAFGFVALPLLGAVIDPTAWRRPLRLAGACLVVAQLVWSGWRHTLNARLVAFPADTLEGAATFLATNSAPGDVVFHTRWDNFGPLFAHNRTNRYLGGMDPIFQFAHDPRSYWEFFYLSADVTSAWTCDAYPCAQGTATDTHVAMTDHFGARWVLVEPRRNPGFARYLLDDPGFELAFDQGRTAVFEVVPVPGADEGAVP